MEHLGGSSKLLRAMNEAAALGHVLNRGRLTRAELRDLTGLSKPTISDAFKQARDEGKEGQTESRPRTRKATSARRKEEQE